MAAEDAPGSIRTMQTLAETLKSADQRPVHILYMHGINSLGSDDSQMFRDSICKIAHLCEGDWQKAGTEYADHGSFAPDAPAPTLEYLNARIWTNSNQAEQWRASAPFVTHYVVRLRGHNAVLAVDEINWWPMVLKLKCEQIVPGDAQLAGPNRELLAFCSQATTADPQNPKRFTQYQWITPADAAHLEHLPNRAALINRGLKTGLEDWGFSDVFLGVGPLRPMIEEGIRQLVAKSAAFDPRAAAGLNTLAQGRPAYDWRAQLENGSSDDQVFVAVTHSMGSFLLLDAFDPNTAAQPWRAAEQGATPDVAERQALQYVVERTGLIYFFANQVPILELANLTIGPASPAEAAGQGTQAAPAAAQAAATLESGLIEKWSQVHNAFEQRLHATQAGAQTRIQIVAFSDPSDLLTWRVPELRDVDVFNLNVQNGVHWLWLIESPSAAHDNYAKNKKVIRAIFGRR
jgi:hypothetical protein